MNEFFSDSQSWVLLSFIIFVFLAFKLGRSSVTSSLDAYIAKAQTDLTDAENLRVEAQELLSKYQGMQRAATSEADEIIIRAESHAEKIRKSAKEEINTELARREEQLKERLSRMETQAIEEMRAYAADLAIKATREIIIENIDNKKAKALNDQAIADIEKNFAA